MKVDFRYLCFLLLLCLISCKKQPVEHPPLHPNVKFTVLGDSFSEDGLGGSNMFLGSIIESSSTLLPSLTGFDLKAQDYDNWILSLPINTASTKLEPGAYSYNYTISNHSTIGYFSRKKDGGLLKGYWLGNSDGDFIILTITKVEQLYGRDFATGTFKTRMTSSSLLPQKADINGSFTDVMIDH